MSKVVVKKAFQLNDKVYEEGSVVTQEDLGSIWEPFLAHGRIEPVKHSKSIFPKTVTLKKEKHGSSDRDTIEDNDQAPGL